MVRGSMEQLDKVGCEYGRLTKESLLSLCKEIEVLKVKKDALANELEDLKEQIKTLVHDFSSLKTRFAWLIGALTIAGSLAGQILGMIFKAALGGH